MKARGIFIEKKIKWNKCNNMYIMQDKCRSTLKKNNNKKQESSWILYKQQKNCRKNSIIDIIFCTRGIEIYFIWHSIVRFSFTKRRKLINADTQRRKCMELRCYSCEVFMVNWNRDGSKGCFLWTFNLQACHSFFCNTSFPCGEQLFERWQIGK